MTWAPITSSGLFSLRVQLTLVTLYWQWEILLQYFIEAVSAVKSLSRVRLSATPWTVARQAPLSMGFSRQECWSGLPFPSPEDIPDQGTEPTSFALQVDSLPSEPLGKPKNTAVGSLSLCQGIFPSQESNQGLWHCRWILLLSELPRKPLIKQGKLIKW